MKVGGIPSSTPIAAGTPSFAGSSAPFSAPANKQYDKSFLGTEETNMIFE